MGAWTFETYAEGEDPDTAFDTARRNAMSYGHHCGTIADKHDYMIITDVLTDLDDAEALAATLIDCNDPRIVNKEGPAGAIPVRKPTRTVRVENLTGIDTGYMFGPDELNRIAGIARSHNLIGDGEIVTDGFLATATCRLDRHQVTYNDGVAELTVRRRPADLHAQTGPDGWLFFGWVGT